MNQKTLNGCLTLLVVCLLAWAPLGHAAKKPSYIIELPININAADALTLSRALVGVGPKKAAAIVDYREQFGPFRAVEDLAGVKGIGPGTLRKNQGRIRIE